MGEHAGSADPYLQYVKPDLGPRMDALGLVVEYHRGAGDWLHTRDLDGADRRILDMVGGYGASLFGHAHPEILQAVASVLEEQPPFLAQGSRRGDAARLASTLTHLLRGWWERDYVAVFSSTGTAAVELALLHAHLQHQRRGCTGELPAVLLLQGAFHGVAIQAMRKRGFPGPELIEVSPSDPRALTAVFERERRGGGSRLMAAMVETIQGEGGVRPVPRAWLMRLQRLCREHGIPLIVDEVQTGMGRTGAMLDSLRVGLEPDILTLAKALGGGLTKIGLTLIDRSQWVEGFDGWSTSTFAEDPFSARAALATVELLTRSDGAVLEQVRHKGRVLRDALEALAARHPTVVREIRGHGLMLGVELHRLADSPSPALRSISEHDHLGYFLASALLHQEGVRVMPPVSAPDVLRLQPSYLFGQPELERLIGALDHVFSAVGRGDCAALCRHLVGIGPDDPRDWSTPAFTSTLGLDPLPEDVPKVAFLGHFIHADHLADWDASFARYTTDECRVFFARLARFLPPQITRTTLVTSSTGARTGMVFVGLPQTAEQYAGSWRRREVGWLREALHQALDLGREAGCTTAGFGGFTSIVLDNLRTLDAPDLALTTGNALTAAAGVDALLDAADRHGITPSGATLGIVGALGNIASVHAQVMVHEVGRMVLIGTPRSETRLARFRETRIPEALRSRVEISTSLDALQRCDLVLTASNAAATLLEPGHLATDREVVICDLSVPADCGPDIEALPHCEVIRGGLVSFEGNGHLDVPGIPLPRGQVYACMAETVLLGLEGIRDDFSRGTIEVAQVERIRAIARKHGARFAAPMHAKPM